DFHVTGVQTCALPIYARVVGRRALEIDRDAGDRREDQIARIAAERGQPVDEARDRVERARVREAAEVEVGAVDRARRVEELRIAGRAVVLVRQEQRDEDRVGPQEARVRAVAVAGRVAEEADRRGARRGRLPRRRGRLLEAAAAGADPRDTLEVGGYVRRIVDPRPEREEARVARRAAGEVGPPLRAQDAVVAEVGSRAGGD